MHTNSQRKSRPGFPLSLASLAILVVPLSCATSLKQKNTGKINTTNLSIPYDVVWAPSRKLTWADFRNVEGKFENFSQPISDAISFCSILTRTEKVKDRKEYKVFVAAVFHQKQSWVDPNKKTNALLIHEQGHFDLAEIVARKMRKAFSEEILTNSNAKIFVDLATQKYYNEYAELQLVYDLATNHGTDRFNQIKWDQQIKEDLRKFNAYKQ